jgi:hypothetical protein
MCFTDLGKLNLTTEYKLEPIFAIAPAALKMKFASKVVKIDSK